MLRALAEWRRSRRTRADIRIPTDQETLVGSIESTLKEEPEDTTIGSWSRGCNDPLTGLLDRPSILEILAFLAQTSTGTVLVIDVDNLGSINTAWGQGTGNEVLAATAGRVRNCLRRGDRAGRLGSDELIVVAASSSPLMGDHVGQRVLEAMRSNPVRLANGGLIDVRVSVGVASLSYGDNPDEVLARAELALGAAKRLGRDQQYAWHSALGFGGAGGAHPAA